ncbi:transglycosylase domain-containing protein [Halomonas urumqiensis]|uniref:peptidoglycan glycosyltransferase n=1 Tax=Halomonas urumqiensis TaxID=1684789 RepID=A0A2N7UGN8_9GAMM|nr:transglycosylase domain-containing protein [Halomonas urumqiensis]PMR79609.1 glycosyl transferase family 51 [Halomonas urumqiensis]PTB01059.1 penicillin-binding protein [Halomonas urumqiensis]GHE22866.1 glycosyl transferase family 51 [Halomonas urumqiensis]
MMPTPHKPRRLTPWLILVGLLLTASLATLLVAEARTSRLQSQELSRYARALTYSVSPGVSDLIRHPQHGPFDTRFGYTRLPEFDSRLTSNGFIVERQARFSPALMEYTGYGLFPPFREKTQAGLTLEECRGQMLYQLRQPAHQYPHFDAVPPLILEILLFIENRELLDTDAPNANPAVDWPRFAKAAVSQIGQALDIPGQSAGGSTLATQIEKYRHSPHGLTATPMEKLRQMISASVRGYRHGPQTLTARQDVALDYLNSVPLSAVKGHGEVHGLGDGLWAWFNADFDQFNRLLVPGFNAPDQHALQGLAVRQAVALMIAQRRPSWYLNTGRDSLERLTDSYLRLLTHAQILTTDLRDAALDQRLVFRDHQTHPIRHRVGSEKGLQVARLRLANLLGTSLHELDRLDLTASTTLNSDLQRQVSMYLKQLADPQFATDIGLVGDRLLWPETTEKVHYSFTLLERSEDGFRVRVQTDNGEQPFDINAGSKLELGSTAKLRVLANYLEVVAELHARHSGKPAATLREIPVDRQDHLSRWVLESLMANPSMTLSDLLDTAMQRRYSASPSEAFFTGGGRHTFSNFRRQDNGRHPTLEEAMRESLNLPFVRLLRDLVNYSIHQDENRRQLLEDDGDPRRQDYLASFADREGRVFLQRFWRKYQQQDSAARLATLVSTLQLTDSRLATVIRYLYPEATIDEFANLMKAHLPGTPVGSDRLATLYEQYAPERHTLTDQGYIARVHPLELWLVGYLLDAPEATYRDAEAASQEQRQEVYGWLFNTRHRNARDTRIRTMLEVEAFMDIHRRWVRLGYPFDQLVPSLATALGSSGDRPAALAELMGIILNDGIRLPTLRIDDLHFATDTPYETRFVADNSQAVRVMPSEVASVLRHHLGQVVEGGTARRLKGSFQGKDGTLLAVGGKTGTGDNRFETVTRSGQVIDSQARNRTATFVFHLGEDHFGTLTAFVPGSEADHFDFTSALPVQVLKGMAPILMPFLTPGGRTHCLPPASPGMLMADSTAAGGTS